MKQCKLSYIYLLFYYQYCCHHNKSYGDTVSFAGSYFFLVSFKEYHRIFCKAKLVINCYHDSQYDNNLVSIKLEYISEVLMEEINVFNVPGEKCVTVVDLFVINVFFPSLTMMDLKENMGSFSNFLCTFYLFRRSTKIAGASTFYKCKLHSGRFSSKIFDTLMYIYLSTSVFY